MAFGERQHLVRRFFRSRRGGSAAVSGLPTSARARIVHGPAGFGTWVFRLTVNGCCRKVVASPPRTDRVLVYRLFLPPLLLLSLPACATDPWVELGGERYSVAVADDDAERARGLMFRVRLEPGHGML